MQFAFGSTRWVILTNKYAIKIARFRPIRPILQLCKHLVHKEVSEKLRKFDSNLVRGGFKYLTAGIQANRAEWKIYSLYGSDILAPTIWTFYGLINIQVRGEKVSEADIERHYLLHALRLHPIEDNDVFLAKQFCTLSGTVVLVDYGRNDLIPVLKQYHEANTQNTPARS